LKTPSRRIQQSNETRQALLKAGKQLFSKQGYAGTSAETIVEQAGVSRGALYHHFKNGKAGLFEAVVCNLQSELLTAMSAAARAQDDPWDSYRATLEAYFDFSTKKAYRQITLLDGPSVLGAQRWRDIGREYSLSFIERGMQNMIDQELLRPMPAAMMASAIFGACCEATQMIAASGSKQKAKKEAVNTMVQFLRGCAPD